MERNDPRFPDRPQHEDFWRISEAFGLTDGRADAGESFTAIVSDHVDEASLIYVAQQRALRVLGGAALSPQLMALYADAFVTGVVYQKLGGHQPVATEGEQR